MLVLVLTVALFVGGVGLGVHILHKDALAQYSYVIIVQNDNQVGIPDYPVRMRIGTEFWQDGETDANGKFQCFREGNDSWIGEIEEEGEWQLEFASPIDDLTANLTAPCTQTFQMFVPE